MQYTRKEKENLKKPHIIKDERWDNNTEDYNKKRVR